MNIFLSNEMLSMGTVVALIMAISQFAKSYIKAKWIPIVNIISGVILCLFFVQNTLPLQILNGIVAGLSASGLWSGVKNVYQGINKE